MVSSTHHLDFIGKSNAIWLIFSKFKHRTHYLLQNLLFLDSTTVEGQHTELLMHSQGIYLL